MLRRWAGRGVDQTVSSARRWFRRCCTTGCELLSVGDSSAVMVAGLFLVIESFPGGVWSGEGEGVEGEGSEDRDEGEPEKVATVVAVV